MFTVVFNTESCNLSYRLAFEPCPLWRKFDEHWLVNLNPEHPHYKKGGVRKLIRKENLEKYFEKKKEAIIIVHNNGNVDYHEMKALEQDLIDDGFSVQVCSFFKKGAEESLDS